MEWKDHKDADRVLAWLIESSNSRYAPIKKLEYFATSMRDFDDVSANLNSILETGTLKVNDTVQRLGDLRRTGLVEKQAIALTPLGAAVLEGWTNYGVANANKPDEFARHLILASEAKRINDPNYAEVFEYWKDLRANFDPIELIDSWDALYVLNALDVDLQGFRPGDRYRVEHTPIAEIEFDLDEFAIAVGNRRAAASADRLNRAIQSLVPRGRARATFASAIEIVLSEGDSTEVILSNFGYPQSPRQWKPFTTDQQKLVRQIAEEYPKLQASIKHTADKDDSAGYDIESFEIDGSPRYVEVKSTNGALDSRFFISSNEVERAAELGSRYVLLRVSNLSKAPQCAEIRAPFDEVLELVPSVYRAEFKSKGPSA